MMNQFQISDVNHHFDGKSILSAVSLEINTGDIIGLFGRNGTGKSTLLKIVFGVLKANHVSLYFNQQPIDPKKVIEKKLMGYLPQNSFLPQSKKVRDVIPLFFDESEKQDQIFYAPKIGSFDQKKIGHLSLGELRYLEFIILAHLDHPFLLLDEPFSMIEPLYKEAIKDYIRLIKHKKGLLLTDHYFDDVFQVTNKNFLIKEAKLIPICGKEDLLAHQYLNTM